MEVYAKAKAYREGPSATFLHLTWQQELEGKVVLSSCQDPCGNKSEGIRLRGCYLGVCDLGERGHHSGNHTAPFLLPTATGELQMRWAALEPTGALAATQPSLGQERFCAKISCK